MSVVMMTLINAPITRVPGKGEAAQQSLALTVDVAPPVMSEIIRAVTVNMKLRRGAPCPARQAMKRLRKLIMVVLAVKVLSTLKFCVASVRKRRASRRQRAEETHTRVYGENACQALFQSRPDAIVRAWFIQSVTPRFKEALRWMAANRKAYHVVDEAELAKASGTEHHGGVCFLIKKRNGTTVKQWVKQAADQDCVLALEDVANPHNLGGMMRSCAHFGVKGVVVQDAALLESGAAIRTAEGGAEHVQPITGESIVDVLDDFRQAGYTVVTTSSERGQALFSTTLPEKMVLVLGREYDYLPEAAREPDDLCVKINGTGNVESLNVSVATGVLLAEWWRQNKA
ncbi:tRNA/rRNA methyltransferase [Salmonella enterica subsp. enterica serovar Mississippi str. A4-633]|nr:tRNA/rRNA methyltransferase [Salmonella enterica subsp. enterica serovar Mississippi str. A4-633]